MVSFDFFFFKFDKSNFLSVAFEKNFRMTSAVARSLLSVESSLLFEVFQITLSSLLVLHKCQHCLIPLILGFTLSTVSHSTVAQFRC